MSRAVTIIDGIPRLRGVYASSPEIYDESFAVGVGGINTGVGITLPNSQAYQGAELQVFLNGVAMEYGNDYTYVGETLLKTQISFLFDLIEGDQVRFRIDVPASEVAFIYNAGLTIGVGGVTAGNGVTLPNARTYNGDELQIVVNGISQEHLVDYVYVGTGEYKTQVAFTYDLVEGDRVVFRIE